MVINKTNRLKPGNINEGAFEMKRTLLVVGIVSIAVLVFGAAGFAYAQSQTPETFFGHGPGMMGNYEDFDHSTMMGGYGHGIGHGMMGGNGEYGPMHESMITALAEALDLSPEELEDRHDAGETLWEIAEAEGLNAEELQELMTTTHDSALEDAVANGLMTEEQAEWMVAHMDQMWSGDYQDGGFGGHCGGGGWQKDNSRWQGEN
jgi:hypothetical protein